MNKFNNFRPYGPHKARLADPIRRDCPRKLTHKMRLSPERAMLTIYGRRKTLILCMLDAIFWSTALRRMDGAVVRVKCQRGLAQIAPHSASLLQLHLLQARVLLECWCFLAGP